MKKTHKATNVFLAFALTCSMVFSPLTSAMEVRAEEQAAVQLDENYFPDGIFREYVKNFDSDKDNILSQQEISKATEIYLDGGDDGQSGKITSLKGIEYLTNVERITLNFVGITDLNLKENKKLKTLHLVGVKLTELNLDENIGLTHLKIGDANLKKLNMSPLTNLKKLNLSNAGDITEIDLSNNHQLEGVLISGLKKLKSFTMGENEKLRNLYINGSRLKSFKTGKLSNIYGMGIIQDKKLKSLNTKNMPSLVKLDVSGSNLEKLNVSGSRKLVKLRCAGNKLKNLNLSKNKKLRVLYCKNNKIKTLNISKTKLKKKTVKCDKKVKLVKKSKSK